jgi:Uma2 family endonuclease
MATAALKMNDEPPIKSGSRRVGFDVIHGKGSGPKRGLFVEPRYEIIDGIIYMMASPKFWHQHTSGELSFQLKQQLAPHGCLVMAAPFDVYLFWDEKNEKNEKTARAEKDFVEPDIFIACDQAQIKRLMASEQDYYHGVPKFIVEIVSPSNSKHDLIRKADLYYRVGVAEYWVVEPITRTLNIFTQPGDGTKYGVKIVVAEGVVPLGTFPGVSVDFDAIFPPEPDAPIDA